MRIAFNLLDCGLGNNGGSQTIIRMADELYLLGHNVKILINQPNKFTWFDVPEYLIYNVTNNIIPEYDIMIATGCSTVKSTLAYNKLPMDKKFYWIRAIETWGMPLHELISGYGSGLHLIVNSEWQRRFIYNKTGIVADIVYSGLPIRDINEMLFGVPRYQSFFEHNGKVIIGALASKKSRKNFPYIVKIAYELNNEDLLDKLVLIGNESLEEIQSINKSIHLSELPIDYYRQPTMLEKLRAMMNCDIWLSTTNNEGLHIPPLEAALCGCFLISRDKEESGLSDYSINGYTSLNYITVDDAVNQIKKFISLEKEDKIQFNNRLVDLIRHKIGSVSENASRMIKVFNNEL